MANTKDVSNCWIFIDNSNMFIEGQKFFAHHQRLKVPLDQRFRIDMGQLVKQLVAGRSVAMGKLYGSEPPALDTVWKAIREKEIKVEVFGRSFQGKEKEVDNAITAAVVEECINNKEKAKEGVFIIVSGDRDYISCIKTLLRYGWHVEICSWSDCLSQEIRQLTKSVDNKSMINIRYLDDIVLGGDKNKGAPRCYFIKFHWDPKKSRIPRHRTIVLKFCQRLDRKDCEQLTFKITDKLKWPCMYTLWRDNDEAILMILLITKREMLCDINNLCNWDNILDIVKSWGFKNCLKIISAVEYFSQHDGYYYSEVWESEEDTELEEKPHDWVLVQPKERVRLNNYSSSPCRYHFCCRKGVKCGWKHNEDEKRFFKEHQGGQPLYKCKPCYWESCKYERDSLLCPYAHNLQEAWCYICETQGLHWMTDCPDRKQVEN